MDKRSDQSSELEELAALVDRFASDRDWQRFHNPKNLATSLAVEVGELLEHFQWSSGAESWSVAKNPKKLKLIREELADVLIYLVRLADVLEVDLPTAAREKVAANERRYPVDRVRGSAEKQP